MTDLTLDTPDTQTAPNALQASVLQEMFAKALTSVIKAIDARPPLPVLANVLIEAEDSRLRIAASNLQMSITVWIGAKVDRPGTITMPAKTLTDLVGRLSKDRVDLTLDDATSTLTVRCGSTVAPIKGIASTEYPPIKASDEEAVFLPAKTLKSMIVQTAFAAAKEDNRPILTGVYVRVEDDKVTLAAADGYRLAVRHTHTSQAFTGVREFVVPAKTMLEVARLIDDSNAEVSISTPAMQTQGKIVTFRLPNIDVSSQVLEGRFPDFAAIIPKRHNTRAIINTQDWLKKCQIVEIFSRDDSHSGRLEVSPFRSERNIPFDLGADAYVMMSGRSAERGSANNYVEARVEGERVDMSFDVRFLIEALNVIDAETVVFEANGAESPGVLKIDGRDDLIIVLMPMTRG